MNPDRKNDAKYMRLALDLAVRGRGWTSPNPVVGAVIVKDEGLESERIIGQGYHERYGDLHAERNALKSCREDPAGATMYVTLAGSLPVRTRSSRRGSGVSWWGAAIQTRLCAGRGSAF